MLGGGRAGPRSNGLANGRVPVASGLAKSLRHSHVDGPPREVAADLADKGFDVVTFAEQSTWPDIRRSQRLWVRADVDRNYSPEVW